MTDPPLVDRPTDDEIQRHIDEVRHDFDRLVELSRHPELRHESERSLSAFVITQTGEWPDTTVVVSFRHTARPGLVLQRSFRVFDLQGRPIGSWSRADDLEEDMYSAYVSPSGEAVDGVLET